MAEVSVEPQMMTTLTVRVVSPSLVRATPTAVLRCTTGGEIARDVIGVLIDAGFDVTAEVVGFNQAAAKVVVTRCEHCGQPVPNHTPTCCRNHGA